MQQHAIKSCHSARSGTHRPNPHVVRTRSSMAALRVDDGPCKCIHRGITHGVSLDRHLALLACCQHRKYSSSCCCFSRIGYPPRCPLPYAVGALRLQTSSLDPVTYRVTVRRINPGSDDQSNENNPKTNIHSSADRSTVPSVPCRSLVSENRDSQWSSNNLLIATAAQVRNLFFIAGLPVFLRDVSRAAVRMIQCQGSTASKINQSMSHRLARYRSRPIRTSIPFNRPNR